MRYLTIEQREALQAALNARGEELRASVADSLEGDGTQSLTNHEAADDPVADLETSLDVAHLSRDVLELREIEGALRRLHTPDYGLCADCGEEIPFIRLQAKPQATRCIGCQSGFERSHAQPGHASL